MTTCQRSPPAHPKQVEPRNSKIAALYQRPYQLTHRHCLHVMAGEGPTSTTLLLKTRKVMDAGLRRHDEVGIADEPPLRAAGVSPPVSGYTPISEPSHTVQAVRRYWWGKQPGISKARTGPTGMSSRLDRPETVVEP